MEDDPWGSDFVDESAQEQDDGQGKGKEFDLTIKRRTKFDEKTYTIAEGLSEVSTNTHMLCLALPAKKMALLRMVLACTRAFQV